MTVAALFVRVDSPYRRMADVDCWDAKRDARHFPGGAPVVAHPPCGQWGRLRQFARVNLEEKSLAPLALDFVRINGGVLEHPAGSALWRQEQLPPPGMIGTLGDFTFPVLQSWFGHPADKPTWLYVVGCRPQNLPQIPMIWGEAPKVVGRSNSHGRRYQRRPECSKAERELTPPAFAEWLVEVARRCAV